MGRLLYSIIPVLVVASIAVLLERAYPRYPSKLDGLKWMTGTALISTSWLLGIFAVPLTGGLSAVIADRFGSGLINASELPWVLGVLIGFLAFDFLTYVFHRVLHEIPFLWRIHRVHHSDDSVDASTALRVHPIEPLIGSFIVIIFVGAVGIPPEAILIHFLFMQVFNFWHHANIKSFPHQRRLAVLFNIPELHEVHHSVAAEHHNANYGSVLSIWDRFFGTLVSDPTLDGNITYGLDKDYWDHPSTIESLMIDPIRK